ncbi:MAG: GNAT family N-acetyltransferase [Defluviitaleaceae bacterium]|nr:GNAT family N-acetyltransferase [Defluviitaleaceae bacterium]
MIAWEDETSEHLLMYEADVPVATGRIVMHDGKYSIGRVAVLKEHRGKGYGRVVMNDLINRAYRLGAKEIEIHAQSYLVNFYSSFGFEICSEEYEEAGIMHFTMILKK